MKSLKLTFAAVVAAIAAVGCNPQEEIELSTQVAGTYSGWGWAQIDSAYISTPMVEDGQTVTVTALADNSVTVNYVSQTWGTFSIDEVEVTESNGAYVLSGAGTVLMSAHGGTESSYDCNLTATITSTDDFTFTFDVPSVMGGTTIIVSPGEIPADLMVNGTYTGTLDMYVMDSPVGSVEDTDVTVVADGDSATLTIAGFGIGTMTLDDISVPVALATASDGTYTLTNDNVDVVAGEYNVTGSLSATVSADGSTLTLTASIIPGAMPMTVDVVFTGEK